MEHIYECSQDEQKEIKDEEVRKYWDEGRIEIGHVKFIKELLAQFEKVGVGFPKSGYSEHEMVFMVAASFQYYSWPFKEWPYDWYIIRPGSRYIISPVSHKRENVSACFALAVRENNNKISHYLESLRNLIKGFSGYRKIEVDAWKCLSRNIPYYWMWKREYENRGKRFEALCNAIKLIVQGICEKETIKYKGISHRVKGFDKFYDKLIAKINSNETCEKLEVMPDGVDFPSNIKHKISYDSKIKQLIFKGIMSKEEKVQLQDLANDPLYIAAIETFFRKSQQKEELLTDCAK